MSEEQPENPSDEPTPPPTQGLRHRVLGLRGVAAVALASLVIGGAGGATLGHLSNGADDGNGFGGPGGGRFQPGGGNGRPPGGFGGPNGQPPGGTDQQLPGGSTT